MARAWPQRLDLKQPGAQALFLCPTRELCIQVAQEVRKPAKRAFARLSGNKIKGRRYKVRILE